jgi:hypothetical protein
LSSNPSAKKKKKLPFVDNIDEKKVYPEVTDINE